jgi:uncharacterized repeat protein (TIGR02543 family)
MKTKKFIAFLAAVIITAGAITTGTVLLLQSNNKATEKPAGALTAASLMKSVSRIPAHFLPSIYSYDGYIVPYDYYIEFGEYPQTHVANEALINNLNTLAVPTNHQYLINGSPSYSATQTWTEGMVNEYYYNGDKYVKQVIHHAVPYNDFPMSTGVSNQTNNAWFRVEPLLWFVTNYDAINAGTATTMNLLAVNSIIAGIPFHNQGTITYYDSGIRAFLNGTGTGDPTAAATAPAFTVAANKSFLQTAFTTTAQSVIDSTSIENNTDYSGYNDSNDRDTADKIYIPSYSDIMDYWPSIADTDTETTRKSKPTDFAMANYADYDSGYDAGYYWLRTAVSSTYVCSAYYDIPSHDYPSAAYVGLRPAFQILIENLQSVDSVGALTRTSVTYNYDLNGGSGTSPTGGTIMTGNTITLPAASATVGRVGYIFSGWGVNNSTTKTHNAGATGVIITGNTVIYAIWTPIDYTITYNMGGGAWVSDYTAPADYNMESLVTLPTSANIIRNGYVFLRWHEGSITGTVVTVIRPGSTIGDKKYYAEWGYTTDAYAELEDYIKKYKLEHDDDYDEGYAAYVNEYAFVTWKILQGNETIGGPLTVYAQYGESVNTPYGTQIQELDLPTALQTVQSKQYTYTFSHWSLTPQVGENTNPEADFPKSPAAAHVVYYAQYTRVEREYTVTWVIPDITQNDQLDYSVNMTKITETYTYGQSVVVPLAASTALTNIYGTGVNYLPNGWAVTQGGVKVTDFGKCTGTGERTFYARYIPQPTV